MSVCLDANIASRIWAPVSCRKKRRCASERGAVAGIRVRRRLRHRRCSQRCSVPQTLRSGRPARNGRTSALPRIRRAAQSRPCDAAARSALSAPAPLPTGMKRSPKPAYPAARSIPSTRCSTIHSQGAGMVVEVPYAPAGRLKMTASPSECRPRRRFSKAARCLESTSRNFPAITQ